MIGNVTTGKDFRGLARYLTRRSERVAWTGTRNTLAEDGRGAAEEMELMSERSTRCKKPVYHLSLSWPAEDAPTHRDMEEVCDAVLERLGLSEHQVFMVAHSDTSHPHVHLMISRVHMETGKAWSTSHDYRRIQSVLQEIERERGWQIVPNREERPRQRAQELSKGEIREAGRTGERPFVEQVRDRAGERIAAARTWGELVGALQGEGLRLEERERGLVVTDGERHASMSRVSRAGGRHRLEEKYGQTLAAYLQEMERLGRKRGRLRRGDRGAPEGYRRVRPRARTLSERRSEGTAYDRMRRHVDRKAQRLFRGDSTLRRLHVDVQVYLKLCEREKDLEHARREHAAVRERCLQVTRADRKSADLSSRFDRSLGRAYASPERARRVFLATAQKWGRDFASGEMERRPERFGMLRMQEQRRLWGLVRILDPVQARQGARQAADMGLRYLEAERRRMPAAERKLLWDTEARLRGGVRELERCMKELPDRHELLCAIGDRMAELEPGQKRLMTRATGDEAWGTIRDVAGRALRVRERLLQRGLERGRGLER